MMDDGHCLRDQAAEVYAAAGTTPSSSISAASLSTLVRMVEGGLGPTLVPVSALAVELRSGQVLVARSFEGPRPNRTLSVQWRASSPNTPWFTEVGALLREHHLALNATIPEVAGPRPRIRRIHS